jgi:uncharacterized protein DUF1707
VDRLWPRADLRAGDRDRQAVVAELQRHYVEGRLSSEELSERVARALQARTFGELADLVADLPALEPRPSNRGQAWLNTLTASPLALVLLAVGVLGVLSLFVLPMGHFGMFPFWPVLIWGFFFIGRPRGGGRRQF